MPETHKLMGTGWIFRTSGVSSLEFGQMGWLHWALTEMFESTRFEFTERLCLILMVEMENRYQT